MEKLISKIEKAVLVFSAFGLFACILWNAVNVILNFGESSFTQIFDAFLLTGILLLFQALIFAMLWANKNQ